MKSKFIIGLGIVALVVLGWLMLGGDTINYVATIDDEVMQLESELAELEVALASGELTPEEAAEAQRKIVTRIEAINKAVEKSQGVELSASQRNQLLGGLERLKNILTDYRDTLVSVDEAVMELPAAERPKLNPRGSGSPTRTIVAALEDTVTNVEEYVEDVVDEYVPEDTDVTTDEGAATTDSDTMSEEGGMNEIDPNISNEDTDTSESEETTSTTETEEGVEETEMVSPEETTEEETNN